MALIRTAIPTESIEEFCDRNDLNLVVRETRSGRYEAYLEDCEILIMSDNPYPSIKKKYLIPALDVGKPEEEAIRNLCSRVSEHDLLVYRGGGNYERVTADLLTYDPKQEEEKPDDPIPCSPPLSYHDEVDHGLSRLVHKRIPGVESLAIETEGIVEFNVPTLASHLRFSARRDEETDAVDVCATCDKTNHFFTSPETEFLESLLNQEPTTPKEKSNDPPPKRQGLKEAILQNIPYAFALAEGEGGEVCFATMLPDEVFGGSTFAYYRAQYREDGRIQVEAAQMPAGLSVPFGASLMETLLNRQPVPEGEK